MCGGGGMDNTAGVIPEDDVDEEKSERHKSENSDVEQNCKIAEESEDEDEAHRKSSKRQKTGPETEKLVENEEKTRNSKTSRNSKSDQKSKFVSEKKEENDLNFKTSNLEKYIESQSVVSTLSDLFDHPTIKIRKYLK